ncbi:MAG: excinuclease ABC subunit C, partial [Beggiatoa sp. IS2]
QPRYNILLRDDKSYPYIHLSDHPFPRLMLYRGVKRTQGQYFGPYPHTRAAQESLHLLQKIFQLRPCPDSFFRHRARPCLQYQIARCSAPCVNYIEATAYQETVIHATLFLTGKSQTVIRTLVAKMETASRDLAFEQAACYRDQIRDLQTVQERQYVSTDAGNVDVVVALVQGDVGCVEVLTIRDGHSLGNRAYFPQHVQETDAETLLAAFLPQYYLATHRDLPDEIILNGELADHELLTATLRQHHGRRIAIHTRVRGTKAHWLDMALANATASIAQHQPYQYQIRLNALTQALSLDAPPQRLICFDVSHTQGEATVAACVVFNNEGACPHHYRRFNITGIQGGDDYAAMRQALTRYFQHLPENTDLPDILLIDGGKGQVAVAQTVLTDLQLPALYIVGVAKGVTRKPGLETLILSTQAIPLILPTDSPALHLIQQIRDEAHRFAITAHRRRRAQARRTSVLEQIEGIGPKRRQQLLKHFGGLHGVLRAGVEDLARVPGINKLLAQKIYDFLTSS